MEALKGKVALVTGGGRGIGRAIALALADRGLDVAVVARSEVEVHEVSREISQRGVRSLAVTADVADWKRVDDAVALIERTLGPVDVLVNNAGHSVLGHIHALDPAVWWRQIEVNLGGTYAFCRAILPKMVEQRWGRVVNISSVAGKVGLPYSSAYCAAKHGVLGLTRALALEVADKGVTVNAVCPGYVETALTDATFAQRAEIVGVSREMAVLAAIKATPQKVALKPEDVVPAVIYLVSAEAAHTTGEALNVSAGLVMH